MRRTAPSERLRQGLSLNRLAKIALSALGALIGPASGNNPEKKGSQGIYRQHLALEDCGLLILILFGLGACSKPMDPVADHVDNSKPRQFFVPVERQQQFGVTYTEARRRQMRLRIRSFGTLDVDQAQIFECVAHMDGYIDELQVGSPGERVTVGQPLMTIYTPTLRSSEQEYASLLKVQESGNVPPDSLTQLIDSNRRRLQRMGVSPEQISELERTKQPTDLLLVRSPCDGIVSEAPMAVGLSVKPGDKLIGLLNLSRLWLWVSFYEDEVNLLKEGEPMTVVFPALANRSFKGKISVITATIDPVKRTTLVRIDIPNPDGQLRPGMSANVTTDIDAGEDSRSHLIGSSHWIAEVGFCRAGTWQIGTSPGSPWTAVR